MNFNYELCSFIVIHYFEFCCKPCSGLFLCYNLVHSHSCQFDNLCCRKLKFISDFRTVSRQDRAYASQKDSGYAWVVLGTCCLSRILLGCGEAMMGVLLLELGNSFDATPAELVAASTTQFGISLSVCKYISCAFSSMLVI